MLQTLQVVKAMMPQRHKKNLHTQPEKHLATPSSSHYEALLACNHSRMTVLNAPSEMAKQQVNARGRVVALLQQAFADFIEFVRLISCTCQV